MSVGTWEVVVIVLVALLVFGGKGLPRLGLKLGRGVRYWRRASSGNAEADAGKGPSWVSAAGELSRTARQVRQATKLGRWL